MKIISPKRLLTNVFQTVRNGDIFANSSLDLPFARTKTLDTRITFTRASSATFVGSDGLLKTATTNEPRFDHNPTTGESLGLLVEEARTNGIRNNTMVGAVAGTPGTNPNLWQYVTAQSNGLTVSVVGTGTESGINYIDYRFNGTTVASPNGIVFGFDNATAATGQTWTNSIYWKLAAGTATGVTSWQIGVIELTAVGTFITGANYSQTAPTSAALITQRPAATRTFSGGVTVGQAQMTLNINVAGNTAIDFTIRVGLPQMEQGAFATSPILTSTATVTRAADVASITGSNFSSFYNQAEGTVFAEFGPYGNGGGSKNPGIVQIDSGSAVNTIRMFCGGSTSPVLAVDTSSVNQAYISAGTLAPSATSKISGSYKINDFARAFNGSNLGTDNSGTVPTVSQMLIGTGSAGVTELNGTLKRLTFWPTRLANTTIQQITQP